MKRLQKPIQVLIALILVFGMIGPLAMPLPDTASRLHPMLAEMTGKPTAQMVRVIVVKADTSKQAENVVERLGGKITQDLHFINAFAALLPVNGLISLEKSPEVVRILVDAPVLPTNADTRDFYLYNHPIPATQNTRSRAVLPLSETIPTGTTLYNYDKNVDDFPGLFIDKGGQGHEESDEKKIQVWRLGPLAEDFHISGGAELTIFAAMKDFTTDKTAQVRAYLVDYGSGEQAVIATGSVTRANLDGSFQPLTINFGALDYVLSRNHQLQLALTVDDTQAEDGMWFAYGTAMQPAVLSFGEGLGDGDTENGVLQNVYNATIGAEQLWAEGLRGAGVTVAVVDSGITDWDDFKDEGGNLRILNWVQFNDTPSYYPDDYYGHGTHVAGVIGGNGALSGGTYVGVAPEVNLITVKVTDDVGGGYVADVVAGLQWIFENKDLYNIRVVNMALNSSLPEPYNQSALGAAVELLWFKGIVVVVAAGNHGESADNGILYPPANDPYVITVGAAKDHGTVNPEDDTHASYSAWGFTEAGFLKPDLVAPGHNIVSILGKPDSVIAVEHPELLQADPVQSNYFYFRMSGTSTAAPVVAGAAALLLQDEPDLTPDQVKYRLLDTARLIDSNQDDALDFNDEQRVGAGLLDAYAAIHSTTTESGNQDIIPHELLAKMAMLAYWASQNGDEDIDWEAVNWNAVNWNAVNWNAVNWNAVNWNAVNWNAVNWNAVNWNAVNWNAVNWNAVNWNAVNWNAVNWNAVNWNSSDLDY